jgi:hypothetical protein
VSHASSLSEPKRRISPALTLAVFSVVIAEVLSGSTHLSTLFAVFPEIMVWGCGAVLIREVVRSRKLSGTALLLMGLALSLAEEILVQQTSLAPLPWLKTAHSYGRAWGVNWIYLLFQLGFESVWVVLVPVQLVELIYSERRGQPWLRRRGLVVTSIVFLLGCRIAWYAWIKRVRPMIFHLPPYHPSPYAFLAGFAAVMALIAAALRLRAPGPSVNRKVPPPALVFIVVLLVGRPWYLLLTLEFSARSALTSLPVWIPMLAGVAWGALALLLIRYWSLAAAWSELHRYAAVFAAMLVCMLGGLLDSQHWLKIDRVAQVVFDLAAIGLMAVLGRALIKRAPTGAMASVPRRQKQ